ncbi:MAG: DMT family transporter [Coriobacteriia bacterium]|nr:DMT family transporter [Coriobacteriia bacterium]
MKRDHPWRGYALALFAACGWAAGGLSSKWIFLHAPYVTPEILAAARVCIAAPILGVYLLLFDRKALKVPWSWKNALYLVVFGALAAAGMQFTYFKTISLTNIATAILLEYLAPIFTLAFAVILFKHKLRWQMVVGVITAILGSAIAVGAFAPGGLTITSEGLIWGLTSAFFFALYSVMGAHADKRIQPIGLLFYGLFFAALMWMVVLGPDDIFVVFREERVALIVLAMSLIATILPFGAFLTALRIISPTHTTITSMVEPVIVGIVAAFLFGETLTASLIVGGAIILGSIGWIQLQDTGTG